MFFIPSHLPTAVMSSTMWTSLFPLPSRNSWILSLSYSVWQRWQISAAEGAAFIHKGRITDKFQKLPANYQLVFRPVWSPKQFLLLTVPSPKLIFQVQRWWWNKVQKSKTMLNIRSPRLTAHSNIINVTIFKNLCNIFHGIKIQSLQSNQWITIIWQNIQSDLFRCWK